MKLGQPLLGITPETLQAVNVDLAGGKPLAVIYPQVPVATEHQGIVAAEFVGINNRATADGLDRHVQKTLGRDIPNHLDLHNAASLENSEDGDLPGGPSTPLAPASAPKVGFIQFNLPFEEQLPIQVRQDRQPQDGDRFEHRGITQSHLLGDPAARQLYFKELNDPQPALIRNSQPVNPSTGEVMERVTTTLAPVPSAHDPVDFLAATPCTKNTAVFCTRFFKEQSGSIFRFSDELKGLEFH